MGTLVGLGFYQPAGGATNAAGAPGARETGGPRVEMSLSTGWRFSLARDLANANDAGQGPQTTGFDDSKWARVDVPHTWNRVGNQGTQRSSLTNVVQGIGWYRLHFTPQRAPRGSRYFLEFDGVGALAEVWLNGRPLGRHAGAFARFRLDATEAIDPSGENVLAVKADNSKPEPGSTTADVIPLSGDFFVFGGLYRNVALLISHPVHFDLLDFGGPGVYSRAAGVGSEVVAVQVSGRVANDQHTSEKVLVETRIEDAAGKTVVSTSGDLAIPATAVATARTSLKMERPRLWRGMKDPYLYRVVMTLRSPQGQMLDRVTQPLGLREVRFDPEAGFFLNGEHVALRGAAMHQDRPVKGWAVSRADQEQDFDLLMDLGANAVRLAHYQHDSYSYELADARGIAAWAEIPLVNQVSWDGSPPTAALVANARQQLTELIRQNFNHPSIVVWSIANEIDLVARERDSRSGAAPLLEALNALAKSEDPDRATTFADCCEVLPARAAAPAAALTGAGGREAIVGLADTIGYNRYLGWYSGTVADLGSSLDAAHAYHPKIPMALSEYGAGAALSQHSDEPDGGPFSVRGRPHPEEVQNYFHEASWSALRTRPYLWGVFIWNLFDFSSLARQEGDLSDINDKGLVSYDRKTRKDAFYFYRANWSNRPTVHLVGRRYTERPRSVIEVKAYSNATEAALTLNGVVLATAPCSGGICLWRSVRLAPGKNSLRATATIDGESYSDEVEWSLLDRSSGAH